MTRLDSVNRAEPFRQHHDRARDTVLGIEVSAPPPFLPLRPKAQKANYEADTIIVSCNHDASEVSIPLNGTVRTFKPPQALMNNYGNYEATARNIKTFVHSKLNEEELQGKEIALHWALPLMTSDAVKSATPDATTSVGFSHRSAVVSRLAAVSSPTIATMLPTPSTSRHDSRKSGRSYATDKDNNVLVVLCDDSGCEMAAYTVSASKGSHSEATISRAIEAGWTQLEDKVRIWLQQRFGTSFSNLSPNLTSHTSEFVLAFFEHVSNLGESDASWAASYLPLPMAGVRDDAYDNEVGCVIVSRTLLLSFLTPLIDEIKAGMQDMVNDLRSNKKEVTKVVLTGSFFEMPYVTYLCEKHARSLAHHKIVVDHQPQTSVTAGAITSHMGNMKPTSTKALRNYGCKCCRRFREGVDPLDKGYWDAWFNAKFCTDRVDWLVRKGQDITPRTTASCRIMSSCDVNDVAYTARRAFVSSTWDSPPDWSDGPGIEHTTAIIETDFTAQDLRERFEVRNGQRGLRSIVKMWLDSDLGVLQAERVGEISGMSMGKTSIRFG